jgi:adenylate cyclase
MSRRSPLRAGKTRVAGPADVPGGALAPGTSCLSTGDDEHGHDAPGAPAQAATDQASLAHLRHELRTPLNAIIGYGELLIEEAEELGAEDCLADLRMIAASGQQILARVNELLSAGADAGHGDLDLDRLGPQIRHELHTPLNAIIGYSELLAEGAAGPARERLAPELGRIVQAARKLLALGDDLARSSGAQGRAREVFRAATLAQDALATRRALDDGAPGGGPAAGGTILVVDDNPSNRDLLVRRLERLGHRAVTAENGRLALEQLAGQAFDLVLLDIMMPEMNGYQVLERLKADPAHRFLPVVMISALDELDSVVRCVEMGAEDYLAKPFNPVLLRARVGACLEKKRLRDREVLHLRQIEAEKKRADELLRVLLPDEIVEELKATQTVRPRLCENVAVLFCDVVGFTPYCERHEPEDVIAHLQELVEAYEELALRYGLQKIKTIGDAFMATAGLLKPVEEPVLDCVRCGLDMVAVTKGLRANWNVRIGIHVGAVVAGVVGQRQYLFDLWGDAVNTAARVESHGESGAVNLSEEAWARVAEYCHGRSLGLVPVKGKGELEILRVEGLRGAARAPAAAPPEQRQAGVSPEAEERVSKGVGGRIDRGG